MTHKINVTYCQQLGKLFYAIALADKRIEKVEYDVFKSKVAFLNELFSHLRLKGELDMYYHITSTFNMLYINEYKVQECYDDFVYYKREHEHLFTKPIRRIILNIAAQIAASFSNQNKSELIMLAKLNIEFKKE